MPKFFIVRTSVILLSGFFSTLGNLGSSFKDIPIFNKLKVKGRPTARIPFSLKGCLSGIVYVTTYRNRNVHLLNNNEVCV